MSLRNCEFDGNGYCENSALLKGVKKVFRYCLHFSSYLEKNQHRPSLKNHSVWMWASCRSAQWRPSYT